MAEANEYRQYLESLKVTHTERLQLLEQQSARLGFDTPPHIRMEIKEIKNKLADIDNQLKGSLLPSRPTSHILSSLNHSLSIKISLGLLAVILLVAVFIITSVVNKSVSQVDGETMLPTTTNTAIPTITVEVPSQTINPSPSLTTTVSSVQSVIAIANQTIENFGARQVSLAANEILIGTADRYQDFLDQKDSQFTVFVIYGPINTELSLYWGGWDQWMNASPEFIVEQLAIKVQEIQNNHPNDIKIRGYRIIECSGSVLTCNTVESTQPVATSTVTIDWQEKEICRGENKTCVAPISINGLCALYFYRRGQPGAVEKTFIFRVFQDVSVINFSGVLYCWQYIPSKEIVSGGHEFAALSEVEAAGISFNNSIEEIDVSILLP